MFTKKTIKDIVLDNKRVLVRVDYNIPIAEDGSISDDYRVKQSLPTLNYLLERKCSIILISHLGRPTSSNDPKTSLRPVVPILANLINTEIKFASDCVGGEVKKATDELLPGQVLLLENLRWHSEEEENSESFAQQLIDSTGAELFVQDAFGASHRAHASIDAIAKKIPAVAGLLLEREVDTITTVMEEPKRPLMVVIGGAKISDKIDVLKKFIEIADFVAVVGAMANTFLDASGYKIGKSISEKDEVDTAKDIIDLAHQKSQSSNFTFFLPRDVVVAKSMDANQPTRIVDLSQHSWADITYYPSRPDASSFEVADDEMILDIGPFTASYIAGAAKLSKTAIWNGTCGVTEVKGLSGSADPFAHGTRVVVDALVGEESGGLDHPFTVVGGGDTVSYIESTPGLRDRFGFVSTGGGASLELMSGKVLPGVSVLEERGI